MASLGPKGRALAMRLVLGANVTRGELDRRIDVVASRPKSMEPRVRDALRLASFELLYLETPRQVAVSQGVELVRSVQPRAAGMANAVLRRVAEARPQVDAARELASSLAGRVREIDTRVDPSGNTSDAAEALRLASGYPEWLVGRFEQELGLNVAAAICDAALEPAPVYVAEGPACEGGLSTCEDARPLDAEPCCLPGSWVLGAPASLLSSGLVEACVAAPCDFGAQCVCRIAAAPEGRMLEVGQGRGTKSLLLAGIARELGGGEGRLSISGCDSVGSKVRMSRARMRTAGLAGAVSCTEFDATHLSGNDEELPEALRGEFGSVLVDAPCSGTGTMRRHPETPWSLREESLDPSRDDSLPALQLGLLTAAAARVAPGGSLCYATCSVLEAENEGVVEAFLASEAGRGFARASVMEAPGVSCLGSDAKAFVRGRLTPAGSFQSAPAWGECDGHFCARLVRVS